MFVLCGPLRSALHQLRSSTGVVIASAFPAKRSRVCLLIATKNTINNFSTSIQSTMSDNFIKRHYDPAVIQLNTALDLAKQSGASEQVVQAIEESLKLCRQREDFMNHTTTQESEVCAKIQKETFGHNWQKVFDEKKTTWNLMPGMMSGPLEGQFLKSILSAQKAKRVLDIGMFTGYSALSIAEALPADGKVVTLDIQHYLKGLVESFIQDSPHKNKISIIIDQGLKTMTTMKENGEQFDAVFMDAAKSEYADYLKLCFEGNLLAPGGTMVVDNAFMRGKAYREPDSPTAKFGQQIQSDPSLHVVLVPIRDGIYLIRRRVDVDGGVA